MVGTKSRVLLLIVIIILYIEQTPIQAQIPFGSTGGLPNCTIASQNGYLPPTGPFFSTFQTTLHGGRIPLLPFPFDNGQNPALYFSIPDNQLLNIIGRAEPTFGDWLFVEIRMPEQAFQYGFVRLQQTAFGGNIADLPVTPIQPCSMGDETATRQPTAQFSPRFITRTVDERFYISLPSNWIYYDANEGGAIQSELYEYVQRLESPYGMSLSHRFVAGPEESEQSDLANFAIFYLGAYQDSLMTLHPSSIEDLRLLSDTLNQALPSLQAQAQTSGEYALEQSNIVSLNGYPFLFLHYRWMNPLTTDQLRSIGIPVEDNEIAMYVFITYIQDRWYQASIIGLRSADSLMQTLMSSLYVN